jgi:hypothetical protein
MPNRLKYAALATLLATGVATSTVALAQTSQGSAPENGSKGSATMHGGNMMQGGNMMNMMSQMTSMMETCNKMMQSAMMTPIQPKQPPADKGATPQRNGG